MEIIIDYAYIALCHFVFELYKVFKFLGGKFLNSY